jgi:diadenylate cyclase
VRDVAAAAQRLEMVRRIAGEIDTYVLELGVEGRLLDLQLEELIAGVDPERELIVRDYLAAGRRPRSVELVLEALASIDSAALVELGSVAEAMRIGNEDSLDTPLSPRGYRLLAKVPRLPGTVVDRLIDHFGNLQKLLGASVDDLQAVEGVGDLRARGVREGLSRLAESSILERYV